MVLQAVGVYNCTIQDLVELCCTTRYFPTFVFMSKTSSYASRKQIMFKEVHQLYGVHASPTSRLEFILHTVVSMSEGTIHKQICYVLCYVGYMRALWIELIE